MCVLCVCEGECVCYGYNSKPIDQSSGVGLVEMGGGAKNVAILVSLTNKNCQT